MQERIWALLLLLLLLPPPLCGGPPDSPRQELEPERGPLQPFDLLYASGVAAYYNGEYEQAVRDLESALLSHRRLREVRTRCARHCAVRRPLVPPGAGPGAELPFFRALLERARCYRSCETQRLGGPASRHRVSEDVRSDFQRRVPYNYLQRAYIKLNQLQKAVEAAHTFFMANPEHMEMQQNIENYRMMAGVEEFQLIDREAKPHLESYSAGVKHYEADDFEVAIKYFERALREYFSEDVECRTLCEGPQRFEEYEYLGHKGGLYETIADHYMQVLVCQHECVRELATRPGRLSPIENFLPLHYDYLQFAYYRVGEYVKALECAKAYLLFHPDDEDVQDNVDYYESLLDDSIDPESIEAREDLIMFVKRHKLESELIKSAAEGLGFSYTEPNYWIRYGGRQDENRVPSGVNVEGAEVHGLSMGKKSSPKIDRDLREGGPLLYENITFVYNSEQLNGTQRVLLDNVLSEEQCRELHSVASGIMLVGDGYRGKTSPHTPNEKFEGATVLKALKFGYEGRVPLKSARLFYDISEKARKIVESYFMLNSTLYFSYTHMVCRTALSGQQDRRNDLSHPIHADNCLLDPEANECWKEPPAYTFRDYSALLYMNDDFEGGEFIFTEMDAKTVTASIKPKCGRMISFSSGGENPHGVKAVTKGQRCAVALWFTLNPLYRELERIKADEVIAILDQEQQGKHELNINPKDEL
ncbi:prolyl 3-hydroxylase 2 [Marmota monax]|uniref:prolyl 3-hydroxylase 2 n=1 Tax=Marmota monax TaxID=9995 RepID=UPI001EAFC263|nr:prolyl 3-hydroxylase 2 [Marmota monax]KAI6051524.1 P3H2 [Marmota monax]KAI6062051.1 P3H2 [Marmota monax]